MGLDNGDKAEHGYRAECDSGTAGGRLRQWHIEGWRRGDGSECGSVDKRQSSIDGQVAALGPGSMAIEIPKRRRDNDLTGIPLLRRPL